MAIVQSTLIRLRDGLFRISHHESRQGTCLSVSYGDLQKIVPIVRLHSSCLFGESFHALNCDCADQLNSTLKLIKKNRSGVVVYKYAEGRGVGLANKIKALELQRVKKINTVEAFKLLGFDPDLRTYGAEIAALADLRVNEAIKSAGQNPLKIAALQAAGYTIVETVHPLVRITKHNIEELLVKRDLLGYPIPVDQQQGKA
jgi:3,4-dihydroxy 2-butanone 4-phosphate synthase / GTP cyclohydrolase II